MDSEGEPEREPEGGSTRILQQFLRRYFEDEDSGEERSLERYLELFPDHQDEIRLGFDLVRDDLPVTSTLSGGFMAGLLPREVGEEIGPYRILRMIGRGGQGDVFEAEDKRMKRKVALKVLPVTSGAGGERLLRFRREAEVASRLNHPGICPVFEMDVHDDVPYLVMPLVPGEPLSAWLALKRVALGEEAFASIPDVLQLVEDIARALHVAHEAGIVHRDVKPANVMVDEHGGHPVVMDFGIARDSQEGVPTLTATGELLGTIPYMSPEQLEGRAVDRRTDVYSLGVLLYECLTFRLPFEAPSQQAAILATLRSPTPDPRKINHEVSRDLKVVVELALEKRPEARFATALSFAEELRRIRLNEPIMSRPVSTATRFRRWTARNPLLAGTTMTAFVALAAGLAVTLSLLGELRVESTKKARALVDKQAALEGKQDALEEKQAALEAEQAAVVETRAALDEVLWLADLTRFVQLTSEIFALWPPRPERVDEIESWLRRARDLAGRREMHAQRLERLKEGGRRWAEGDEPPKSLWVREDIEKLELLRANRAAVLAELDELAGRLDKQEVIALKQRQLSLIETTIERRGQRVREHHSVTMETSEGRWRLKQQRDLVWGIDVLLSGNKFGRTIAHVEHMLAIATTLERDTIEAFAEEWGAAIGEIADPEICPAYAGLEIEPQLGLIPLGRDPRTGLHEFAHHLTGPPPTRDPDSGELNVTEHTGLVLVLLPGGTFNMGAQGQGRPNLDPRAGVDESPVRAVTLDPFFLSKYELTQAQYLYFGNQRPSRFGPGGGNPVTLRNPVETLTWERARNSLNFLDLAFPTEAQWEYGARGGSETPWWTGEEPGSLAGAANVADLAMGRSVFGKNRALEPDLDDGCEGHCPVGRFEPNAFGLHDTAGNIREWCQDVWGDYKNAPRAGDGLRAAGDDLFRVCRGGSFLTTATECRASARARYAPQHADYDIGVRPARRVE